MGCTSFFPSKNLGCYGDGGAIFTNDDDLAADMRTVANHGQTRRYFHDRVGVNSRLDSVQAAVLNVKLPHLDEYCQARRAVADAYDAAFAAIDGIMTPVREPPSTHVFHQYTLRIADGRRDELNAFLAERDITSMIYYPGPLYKQEAFADCAPEGFTLPITEKLCDEVMSLPVHTEMTPETQEYIIQSVKEFFVGRSQTAQ